MTKAQTGNIEQLDHVVVLEPVLPGIEELLRTIVKPTIQIHRTNSTDDAAATAFEHSPCLVICSVGAAQDINPCVKLLKRIHKSIKKGTLKTMVLSKVKNPQLKQLISELGVTDYIMDPIPARTLFFKFNLQINAILAIKKREALLNNNQELIFKKDGEKASDPSFIKSLGASTHARRPALKLPEDIFALNGSSPKKVGKKTVVELEGPPPESGAWQPFYSSATPRFRWVPKDPEAPEQKEEQTGWVHEGDEPVFNPHSKRWTLSGEKPSLCYLRNNVNQGAKIETSGAGIVEVADDSETALRRIREFKENAAGNQKNLSADEATQEEISEQRLADVTTHASHLEAKENQAKRLAEMHQRLAEEKAAAAIAQELKQAERLEELQRASAPRPEARALDLTPAQRQAPKALSRAEQKRQVMQQIHKISMETPATELSDQERALLEEKLDVVGQGLSTEELSKKAKVAELHKLREQLRSVEESKTSEAPDPVASPAFTSGTAQEIHSRKVFFKSAVELGSTEGVWANCDEHFAYLTPEHHGRSRESVRDLMPIWIYSGKESPEFQQDRQEWRFFDIEPRQMRGVKDLPPYSKDFVRALKEAASAWDQSVDPALIASTGTPEQNPPEAGTLAQVIDLHPQRRTGVSAIPAAIATGELAIKESAVVPIGSVSDQSQREELIGSLSTYEKNLCQQHPELLETMLKRKQRELDAAKQPASTVAARIEKADVPAPFTEEALRPFLVSIQVAVSDALLKRKPISEKANRLCTLIAKSLKDCAVTLLIPQPSEWQDLGVVLGTNRKDAPQSLPIVPTANIALKPKVLEGVYATESRALLGYILVEKTGARAAFNDQEVEIVRRYALIIAPYWEELPGEQKSKVAA